MREHGVRGVKALLAALLLAGCGGGSVVGATAPNRATAAACTSASPAGDCATTRSVCARDAQCIAGNQGRCLERTGLGGSACACTYDTCSSDDGCGPDALCACGASLGSGHVSNRCLPTDCRVDADCGAGERCAPSGDEHCGDLFGTVRYACTKPADRCHLDTDCPATASNPSPACTFRPSLGHRACITTQCTQ